MEKSDWEWRQLDPSEHESLGSSEIHGLFAMGRLWAVVALLPAEATQDVDQGSVWTYYTAPDPEDAWNGYEPIDSFPTLEEAKVVIDEDRDQVLEQLRTEK